jgi:hypothetical protein
MFTGISTRRRANIACVKNDANHFEWIQKNTNSLSERSDLGAFPSLVPTRLLLLAFRLHAWLTEAAKRDGN